MQSMQPHSEYALTLYYLIQRRLAYSVDVDLHSIYVVLPGLTPP